MSLVLELIARGAALVLGGWLAYTEATGTYEYYLEQAGGQVTFLVRATVGITLATVILPYFMSRAFKQRRFMRAFNILAAFMLCVSVILTAGVSRTSTAQDTAKATTKEQQRKLDLAKANVKTAQEALLTDTMLVEGECKTGVGRECKRLATGTKDTLDTTIKLRTKLAETGEPVEDNTDKRLSALTLGILSPEQVETIRPLLMPVTLSFVAGLLITLALDHDLPAPTPKPARAARRWSWRREKPVAAPVEPQEPQPAPLIETSPVMPDRPRPRLAAVTKQPIGAVDDFLREGVRIIQDQRLDMVAAYVGYQAWCKRKGLRPVSVAEFSEAVEDIGLRPKEIGGRYYLLHMQLTPTADQALPMRAAAQAELERTRRKPKVT